MPYTGTPGTVTAPGSTWAGSREKGTIGCVKVCGFSLDLQRALFYHWMYNVPVICENYDGITTTHWEFQDPKMEVVSTI
jgi:hypothetical protein